jgi:excisionase family DNA binding protein
MGNDAKKFISVQRLAIRWGVSDSTIRRCIEEGDLKGIKIRRTFKIALESVAEYEKRQEF